jgi:hypothetical protein
MLELWLGEMWGRGTSVGIDPEENVLDSYYSPLIKRLDGLQAEDSTFIELVFA